MNAPAQGLSLVSIIALIRKVAPILIFSRLALAPRLKEIGAVIKVLLANLRLPESFASVVAFVPANAPSPTLIDVAPNRSYRSQVGYSIVISIVIDVVKYFRRLLTVVQKPSKPMGKVNSASAADLPVPLEDGASDTAFCDALVKVNLPANVSRAGAITQHIINVLWNNQSSHFVLPHNLVRGAVALTTVTPIIPRSLGHATP